jgi:hypothetical protein
MTERLLKILVCVGLMLLYFQRLIVPMMAEFNQDRQTLAGMTQAAQAAPDLRQKGAQLMQRMTATGFDDISRFLPAFEQARGRLWSKIEAVQAQHQGIWDFGPGPSFIANGKTVRWPFRLRLEGSFAQVLTTLGRLECEGQIVRVRSLTVTAAAPENIALEATMELLFLDSGMATTVAKVTETP